MTHRFRLRLLSIAILLASRPTAAQSPTSADSAAVVTVVQRLLEAISSRDSTAARAMMLPGSQLAAIRAGTPTIAPRITPDTTFLRTLASGRERYLERMWTPIVRIHGAMADVWAPYDFHVDGKFSHCGIDTFTLMRTPNGWRVVSVAYTVEPAGCAPSPLGVPK